MKIQSQSWSPSYIPRKIKSWNLESSYANKEKKNPTTKTIKSNQNHPLDETLRHKSLKSKHIHNQKKKNESTNPVRQNQRKLTKTETFHLKRTKTEQE